MSDNKETKQAPAVEAGARDELTQFEKWVTTKWRPDDGAKLLKREFPSFAFAAWQARAALARASEAAGEPVDYDRVVQICEAHGIGLPVDCVEMVVEIIRLAAPQAASEQQAAPGEPVGNWLWRELMDYCRDRGIAPANNDRLFEIVKRARAKFDAAPQLASEQEATHVSVPRELFQDLVEEVSDYAASRKFRKSEIEWRKERIEAAWAILAAKGGGHV